MRAGTKPLQDVRIYRRHFVLYALNECVGHMPYILGYLQLIERRIDNTIYLGWVVIGENTTDVELACLGQARVLSLTCAHI